MTAERMIQILSKMPKSAKVYFIDLGSDEYPRLEIKAIGYIRGEGITVAHRKSALDT